MINLTNSTELESLAHTKIALPSTAPAGQRLKSCTSPRLKKKETEASRFSLRWTASPLLATNSKRLLPPEHVTHQPVQFENSPPAAARSGLTERISPLEYLVATDSKRLLPPGHATHQPAPFGNSLPPAARSGLTERIFSVGVRY